MDVLNKLPIATILMAVLVVLAALVGGAVVIWGAQTGPNGLSFHDYLSYLKDFAFAVGALGVGRGIATGLTNHGLGAAPAYDPSAVPDEGDVAAYGTRPRAARGGSGARRRKPAARRASPVEPPVRRRGAARGAGSV